MDKSIAVCNSVKRKIAPPDRLKRLVEDKAEEIRTAVERECGKASLDAEVRLDGSVAKDTWIRDYVDVDIFMRVPPSLGKPELRERCLPIAKRALQPAETVERFAEHPYIESLVPLPGGQLKVNVVPCYKVERGDWLSATDRTPYHTEYIRGRITDQQRDEVRLLKAFMRGIGGYGADIKTGGFSGMLCETLVLAFGQFLNVVREFSEWKENRYVDVENYYEGRSEEVRQIFREPLTVIDPVDKGRNLSAAVRAEQLWNFVAASRHFLRHPSTSFFTESKVKPLTGAEYRGLLRVRGSAVICLVLGRIDAVVDILWSQLYRTQRALTHLLERNDFNVIRSTAWTDEQATSVLIFELESEELPYSRRQRGPPATRVAESSAFLSKHLNKKSTVSGPWVEGERWFVERKRPILSARRLLTSALKNGGSDVGVASLLSQSFERKVRILQNDQVALLISANEEFARFMRRYLSGRPTWLA